MCSDLAAWSRVTSLYKNYRILRNIEEKDDVTKTKFVKLWDRLVHPERTRRKMFCAC